MNTVKIHIKKLLSIVLITIVLLPFAVQFSHALEKHEYSVCDAQNVVHLHHPKTNCSIFHYQINYNTIEFSSTFSLDENILINEKVFTQEVKKESTSLFHKSSRAPPSLLFLS